MKPRRALLLSITVVLALCAACGVWLHRERQQYALNRQLIAALERFDTTAALALVNAGADPNTQERATPAPSLKLLCNRLLHRSSFADNDSPTAFHLACSTYWIIHGSFGPVGAFPESLPLLRAMLAHGADLRATTDHRQNALHIAAYVGRWHTMELLLQQGADVNAKSDDNLTPLLWAAESEDAHSIRLLLARGANPNAQDTGGKTALHRAVRPLFASNMQTAATSMVLELLAHGADPDLPDRNGETPLMLAQKIKRLDLVALLKHSAK